ncbi:hypothetical protein RCH10_004467 [Variovorax sp. GrIS 2.14]|uniref:ATP-dependent DNA ligase n=1 Tax=Variovorax sp. GrIS 2.14 TaxID=3071709 RepID=UPI0038F75637
MFDLLVANRIDQGQSPYLDRRISTAPSQAGTGGHPVRRALRIDGELPDKGAVLPLQLEGLVAKRMDSPYEPDVRSPNWVKVKPGGSPRKALQDRTMTSQTMTSIPTIQPLPFLEVPAISKFQDCAGIDVVAVDETSLTFELQGPSPFLRQAEKVLMRSSNEALLDGQAVVLRRSTWTQPIGPAKLQVSCRYARTTSSN